MADNEDQETPIEETVETESTEAAAPDQEVEQGLEGVAAAAEEVSDAASATIQSDQDGGSRTIDFILEVPLAVTVEVGRARMTIQDLLQLGQGSVVELEKLAGDPLDIYINGQKVAKGEAVIVNEKFGIRLTDIISPEDRLEQLS